MAARFHLSDDVMRVLPLTARRNAVTFAIGPHSGSLLLDKGARASDLATALRERGVPAEWMRVDCDTLLLVCDQPWTISVKEADHDEDDHRLRG